MTGRSWSLRRRITAFFGATSFVLVTALALMHLRIVQNGANRQLDELVQEEVEETQGRFLAGAEIGDAAAARARMSALTELMRGQAGGRPQAWRLWRSSDRELLGDYGSAELLALVPAEPGDRRLAAGLRWRVVPLTDRYTLGLVMDGRERLAELRRAALGVAGLALGSILVALLAGALLGRRITRDLERVARGIRLEGDVEPTQGCDGPIEVLAAVNALRKTMAPVRQENDSGRLITSGMAHELRSPLQNLMGEAQVALLRERTSAEYREVLESQLEELNELSRLVDNLVTLSSVESGRRPVTIEHFDLAAELRLRMTREFRLAQRRGVVFLLEGDGPFLLEGDREALLLAIRNVVTSAIEGTPRGLEVTLRLRAVGEEFEIVVDDAGPGVPPEEREAIFNPLHRGKPSAGRRAGSGVGFALTRRALSDQGGSIEVGESQLGGSRFCLRLPRRPRG